MATNENMENLGETETRILALLEEAGEEEVGTLCNSLGLRNEIADMDRLSSSLSHLLEIGYINIAVRVGGDLRLAAEPKFMALKLLADLFNRMQWSRDNRQWIGKQSDPIYVLVTEAGMKRAMQILQQYGVQSRGLE